MYYLVKEETGATRDEANPTESRDDLLSDRD